MQHKHRIEIEFETEQLIDAVVAEIARNLSWRVKDSIGDLVKKSLETLDQATINRMVTEYLVSEHISKMGDAT